MKTTNMKITTTYLSTLMVAVLALASRADATIFGVKTCGSDPLCGNVISAPPARLFSFQEDGSLFTDIGTVQLNGQSIDVDGLAVSQTYGLLGFEIQASGSQLVSINPTTAVATTVGPVLTSREIRGAVIDRTGVLWVLDSAADAVLQIDPLTGAEVGTPTSLTSSGVQVDLASGTDIAIRHDGAFIISNGNEILSVDIGTGELTLLLTETALEPGPTSANPFYAGLAFTSPSVSHDLYAYDVNHFDDVYAYDSGLNRTALYQDILSSFNAGRGDLASIAVPEPTAMLLISTTLVGLLTWRRRYRGH